MDLALFQPDIAANVGTLIRFCACMDISLHLIEPCGFPLDDKRMRRSAMDYYNSARIQRHVSWPAFQQAIKGRRLVLATTKAATDYTSAHYRPQDILLMGRESAGVPDEVHAAADLRVLIPMPGGGRSLNVAVSSGMIAGEMLRQTR